MVQFPSKLLQLLIQKVFIVRGRVDMIFNLSSFYREGSREGERKGEEREKRLPCDPESESLQGVSGSGCATTHGRAYHVTPGLRWHGQQLPYSSLHVSTEYSTSFDGILSHKLLETIYVSLYIPTY